MPKSQAERERLEVNAKAQQVLSRTFLTQAPKESPTSNHSKDVVQPTGDIDYSKYNKASKS